MARSSTLLALFGGLLCLSTAASSNRFADNPDRVISRALNPQFAPIGVVQRMSELAHDLKRSKGSQSLAGRATAFNIGPCTVVTNSHVAFGESVSANERADNRLMFFVGLKDDDTFAESSIVKPAEHGDSTEDEQNDWVIMRDNKCLGRKIGWFQPLIKSNSELSIIRSQVFLISFPSDIQFGKMTISVGRVTGFNALSHNILYTVSFAPGSSGGAVLILKKTK